MRAFWINEKFSKEKRIDDPEHLLFRVFSCYYFVVDNDLFYVIFFGGFLLSIFICSFFKIGFSFFLLLLFLSIIIFVYQKYFIVDNNDKRRAIIITFFLLGTSLGILRYEIKDSAIRDISLENKVGQKIVAVALISDEPIKKKNSTFFMADFENILNGTSSISVFGRVLVGAGIYPEYKYGDKVKIYGKLEKPENFSDDFDYISYLAKDGIFYKINFADVEIISSGHGSFIRETLFSIKNLFLSVWNKNIPKPESSLLSGIILGEKSSMDTELTESFKIAGLSHIVALSGYNITVVAKAIMNFFSFLPRNFALSSGIIGILLFVLMTGATSTAVRAGIMALIVVMAQITHRKYRIGRTLIITGFLMILVNPKTLVFDVSFQLSFLATIGIVYVSPLIKKNINFISEKFALREIVATTISAQLIVLPLIIYKMNLLSFVSLLTNILILPIMPTLMFFGFIVGFLGIIVPVLSLPFAWIVWLMLTYIVKISEIFSNFKFASANISWFSLSFMILCYILIVLWFIYKKNESK